MPSIFSEFSVVVTGGRAIVATIDVPTSAVLTCSASSPDRSYLRWLLAPGKPIDPELYPIPRYGFTVEGMNTIAPGTGPSWAPDACTLPTVERPLREAEFDTLFSSAVMGATRTSASTVVLALTPQPAVAAQAAELAARETSCCSFFTFTLTATGGGLSLAVTVPATHQALLDALVERAQIHIGGEGQ